MQIIRHIAESGPDFEGSVVTLGNFDGVHLGHQALIRGAVRDAAQRNIPSVVLTFEPHPLKVLAPERAPKLILAHKDKVQLMQQLGVDIVAVQPFDLPFAKLDPVAFVTELLVGRLKAKKLWVGSDLRFGQGRKGSVDDLLRLGNRLGFEVSAVEPVVVAGRRVSSSRIRELVGAGKVEEVEALLGRHHFISGRVIEGRRRGGDLGFPTANIAPRTEVLPLDGIYATVFHLGEQALLSVSSIGVNPTFGSGPRTVESYIFDFSRDIYGAAVRLSFIKRIREERKFSSAADLVTQIRVDVQSAEEIFRDLKIVSQSH